MSKPNAEGPHTGAGAASAQGAATPADLLAASRSGDRRALARLLTLVERADDDAARVADAARSLAADTHRIGITGATGAGKSTLAAALAVELRRRGHRVAIVAVDPSSPRTGGALLGDRVRMTALYDHVGPDGVFVRSLASRTSGGALAPAVAASATILGAAGYDTILIETVGAGQSDVEIAAVATTTLLVVAPGSGDAVQALKAGIVEVADVIAVNKSDLDGADQLVADLAFGRGSDTPAGAGAWTVPIVKTVAPRGEGVAALTDALFAHRTHQAHRARDSQSASHNTGHPLRLAETLVLRAIERRARAGGHLAALAEAVASHRLSPDAAAERLLRGETTVQPATTPPEHRT